MIARSFAKTFIFVALSSVPLLAKPHEKTAPAEKLTAGEAMSSADTVCGEVLAVDLFNQTFLVLEETKAVETVPFSRWTDFARRSMDTQGRSHLEALDPTDVRTGDRLCILLDPSGATADRIEVLPGGRATQVARACAK